MRSKGVAILSAILAVLVFGASGARADVIHAPAPGASYAYSDTIYFDWAWSSDEYATMWIGFARSADGPWSPRPEKVIQDCSYGYCGPFLSSHAYVSAASIGAGTWWWRLCNNSINIEDDKCQFGSEAPRQLTIAAPVPPVPPPAPVITTGPAQTTTSTAASVSFTDTQPGVGFECWFDYGSPGTGAFVPCVSPWSDNYLWPGTFTLRVRAVDAAGVASAETSYTWTVIEPPPPPPTPTPPRDYTLMVFLVGSGSGDVRRDGWIYCADPTCNEILAGGTEVSLTAAPQRNSMFAGWSGGGCSGTGACRIRLNADVEVRARFTARQPVLSALALSPPTFRSAGKRPSVRFTLEFGADVTFKIEQVLTGRLAGRRCLPVTRGSRQYGRCTRLIARGSFVRAGGRGNNRFAFEGKVGGRKLNPGSYRLVATPSFNGRAGKPQSVSFRISR